MILAGLLAESSCRVDAPLSIAGYFVPAAIAGGGGPCVKNSSAGIEAHVSHHTLNWMDE